MSGMARNAAVIAEKGIAIARGQPIAVRSWRFHVIEGLQLKIHRLFADLENFAKTAANRKSPLV